MRPALPTPGYNHATSGLPNELYGVAEFGTQRVRQRFQRLRFLSDYGTGRPQLLYGVQRNDLGRRWFFRH